MIEATVGTGWRGDIAIDDPKIDIGECGKNNFVA